jgi:hypothetical protein
MAWSKKLRWTASRTFGTLATILSWTSSTGQAQGVAASVLYSGFQTLSCIYRFKQEIVDSFTLQANDVYKRYCERSGFTGPVSFVAHSLVTFFFFLTEYRRLIFLPAHNKQTRGR